MGRIPKLVKERALRELKEKQMRQEASLIEVNERADEVHARESSCSSLSDQSTENCDPDIMELGERRDSVPRLLTDEDRELQREGDMTSDRPMYSRFLGLATRRLDQLEVPVFKRKE